MNNSNIPSSLDVLGPRSSDHPIATEPILKGELATNSLLLKVDVLMYGRNFEPAKLILEIAFTCWHQQ